MNTAFNKDMTTRMLGEDLVSKAFPDIYDVKLGFVLDAILFNILYFQVNGYTYQSQADIQIN